MTSPTNTGGNAPLPGASHQRLNRRRLLQLGGLAATAPILGGCTFSDAFVQSDAASEPRSGDTVVTYWHMWTSDWKILIDGLVDEFNATHPGIFVRALSITGDANAKFLAARAGGDPPDVMTQWNQIVAAWAEKGAIMSFRDLPQSQEIRDWMYPSVTEIGTYEGEFVAIPFSMNSKQILYNKDLFAENGLDPEAAPVTIRELGEIQDRLWRFDDRGFIERIGFMPGSAIDWAPTFAGQWADAANEPTASYENNVRILEWFQTYSNRYDPSRVAAFNQSMTSNVNAAWPFLTGRLGFALDGMWRLVDLQTYAPELNYGVMDLPYPDGYGRESACWINGNFNVIPTQAKHPDEAWEFIKWLTGYQNEAWAAQMLVSGGWIPTSQTITDQPAYQAFMDEIPARRGYVELLNSPNVQITPMLPAQQYYWDRILAAEERVLRLTDSPANALETVQDEVQRELSRVLKR